MNWVSQCVLLVIRSLPFLILTQTGDFYPQQIKLSWTGTEHQLFVTWVTYLPSQSYLTYNPIVCEAAGDGYLLQGTSKMFNAGSEAVPRYQYIHTATLTGLTEDCFYEYKVGNRVYWSTTFIFKGKTPDYSPPYDYDSPFTLIVLGDLGIGPIALGTKELLIKDATIGNFDAVIHLGDIAYNLDSDFGRGGDFFLRMIQPVAARYPYLTIPGNHEHSQNMTHYRQRFKMPDNEANEGTGYFYSWDQGPAHFILFNTEVILSSSHQDSNMTQWNWLLEDLAKAASNRQERPWLIMGTHHPLYCSLDFLDDELKPDCSKEAYKFQALLEDLMLEYKVDLFFQAHVHNYERTAPVYRNVTVISEYDTDHMHINPRAPVYITNGNAGNREGHNDVLSRTPQLWSMCRSEVYGYGRLKVFNKTHLYYEEVSAPYSEVVDYVWLVKTENDR